MSACIVLAATGASIASSPSQARAGAGLAIEALSQPAGGDLAPAKRLLPENTTLSTVSIGTSGPMTPTLIAAAERVALGVGAPSVRGRGFNIGLWAVRRNEAPVQLAEGSGSGTWQFPMGTTALPVDAIGRVMGGNVAAAIGQGMVVLNKTSADLRGARVGDTLDLIAADGNARRFTLGYIAPDAEVGGAELIMSTEQADIVGATVITRVLIFGQFAPEALDAQLVAQGLVNGEGVRINKSWNPPNPDNLLSTTQTKVLLGEFDYRINSDGNLSLDPAWSAANVQQRNFGAIAVRAFCHQRVIPDLQAALNEVAAAGLSFAIDLTNTNTYGGCYNPRFARTSVSFGSVSRHAWAMAIDMNTATNAQGSRPRMDCRVVRIFRKHNFAWGGNFLVPDGMHFEWVGEPRNTIQYPSRYCPNVASGGIENRSGTGTTIATTSPTGRDTMFAGDGWVLGEGDDHR